MAFCGQCGQLLNTNTTRCPRCGAETEFDAALPGIPADDNSTTIIAHTDNPQPGSVSYTPSPDETKAAHYTAPGGNAYPGQRASHPDHQPGDNSYSTRGTFEPGFPHSGSNYAAPGAPSSNSLPQSNNQVPVPGMYQPGVFPITDPGYPYQPPTPQHKTNKALIALIIVLVVALVAVTGLLIALGSNQFANLFKTQNTPTVQVTPTAQPPSTPAPTAQPTSTTAPTAQTSPTQQAQATIQQYYDDINNHNYQDAYNLWVNNPDNYDHFKQGFAHTQHDAITLGDAVAQTDGTMRVNLTLQATENTASGGTQVNTYQGYYTVQQQADGSWKIINGQLS
ncbi:MAG: hypothetical protein JO215_10700 [Ktedonobacteraceae bacterium]|nr:hypothetical protein [Ktedonobacteraceae bacterium]